MVAFIVIIMILLFFFGKEGELEDFIIGLLFIGIRIAIIVGAFGLNPILGTIVLFLLFGSSDKN